MLKRYLTSKIHQAKVTAKSLAYEGSLGLDEDIAKAAGLSPGEIVHVFNIANGRRFETYLIAEEAASRAVALYGAAARLGEVGDRLIVIAYGLAETPPEPKVIVLDDDNNVVARRP